jgi:hypothetical protein
MSISEPSVYLLEMSLTSSHWGAYELMGSGQSGQGASDCQLAILGRLPVSDELSIVSYSVGTFRSTTPESTFRDNGWLEDVTSLHYCSARYDLHQMMRV